jgi:hypothetical protein
MQLKLKKQLAAFYVRILLLAEFAHPIAAVDWFGRKHSTQQQQTQGGHNAGVKTVDTEPPPLVQQQQAQQLQHQPQRNLQDVLAIFGGAQLVDGEHCCDLLDLLIIQALCRSLCITWSAVLTHSLSRVYAFVSHVELSDGDVEIPRRKNKPLIAAVAATAAALTSYAGYKLYKQLSGANPGKNVSKSTTPVSETMSDAKLLEQIRGGFINKTSIDDAGGFEVFEVSVSMKMIYDTAVYLKLHDIDFESLVHQTKEPMTLVFSNALRPFRQRVVFIFFWNLQPVKFKNVFGMNTSGGVNWEVLTSLSSNKEYMREHTLAGYDIGLVIVHHHSSAMLQYDSAEQWAAVPEVDCGGGIAYGIESVHQSPFGVIALDCLLKGHFDVATHETGHLYGADHDEDTLREHHQELRKEFEKNEIFDEPLWSELPINESMGFKKCGDTVSNSRRTVMSYDCPGMYVPRLPHFSCKHCDFEGLAIGYAATADKHGSSNCDTIHTNIGVISNLAKLHPTLLARQHSASI